jgi:hypothetical protein
MSEPWVEAVHDDAFNTDYREKVIRLIELSRDEIIAIVGEIGVYRFADVRWSLENALDAGRKIRILASESKADRYVVGRLVDLGAELYLSGSEPIEKYMVVDRKHWFGRSAVERVGEIHWNDTDGAMKIATKFEEDIKKVKQIPTNFDSGEDPLLKEVNHISAGQ